MTGIELLQTYDKAALVIKQFYLDKLLESLKTDELPENYREFVKAQSLDNETIAKFIDVTPRMLFDVLDEHKVYIEITPILGANPFWIYAIDGVAGPNNVHKTRIDAEKEAIEKAIEILNNKL